jgi:hypothetical protein
MNDRVEQSGEPDTGGRHVWRRPTEIEWHAVAVLPITAQSSWNATQRLRACARGGPPHETASTRALALHPLALQGRPRTAGGRPHSGRPPSPYASPGIQSTTRSSGNHCPVPRALRAPRSCPTDPDVPSTLTSYHFEHGICHSASAQARSGPTHCPRDGDIPSRLPPRTPPYLANLP